MSNTSIEYTTHKLISEFLKNCNEYSMSNLISHCKINELSDNDILFLTKGLAESGEQIKLSKQDEIYDIPSTGGPFSLSTLISPLFLKAFGKKVLKLSVPGRPAGGIDVLAQIKGYQIKPSINNIKKWFNTSGYVHIIASDNITPLDAKLFQFRKENSGIDISSLVIASLLSKKIAVGVKNIGLDIRISKFGNFGKNIEEASQNAIRFNKIAKLAGIKSKCFLTDGMHPQQPYIGRGEAILALNKFFNNSYDQFLRKHIAQCYNMAYSLTDETDRKEISISDLSKIFEENIIIQGGTMEDFYNIANRIESGHKNLIYATSCGIFTIDVEKIRDSIVNIQNKASKLFSDPAGVILKIPSNTFVNKGDILCTFRCVEKYRFEFEPFIRDAFTISNSSYTNNYKEIV